MTRIGIDCRFAGTSSGIGRYTREVVSRMILERGVEYVLFLAPGENRWIPAEARVQRITIDVPHYSVREQVSLPGIYNRAKLDLLFVPHFNVPYVCAVPTVITIHDLILHRYPNQASWIRRKAYHVILRRAVEKARRIVTVSNFTKNEIAHAYGAGAYEKTTVITEGVSPLFRPMPPETVKRVLAQHNITRPYFLYVGNAKEHKNVQTLLDAYKASGRADTDLFLVMSGPEVGRLQFPSGAHVIPGVPDEDLPVLYSGALCFVTASLYEGFGLPVMEAAACGCPVIATRGGALPEVAPLGSVILDPSVQAFAAAMRNPPAKTATPAPLPTWERAAGNTNALLREAIDHL